MHQDRQQPSRPYGSYRTRYDVAALRRPKPEEVLRRTGAKETETGDIPDPKEPYAELIATVGWELTLKWVVEPYLKRVRGALLKQTNMTAEERALLVGSLTTVEHLIEELYKRAGEKVPDRVAESFR